MENEHHYREFIGEAFIAPIRSVLIVDDDYPTYDEVLGAAESSTALTPPQFQKAWRRNPGRIKGVIRRFRQNSPPLLVDIHDGSNVTTESERTVAGHLHQSDLLVLDYQLDGSGEGDGSQAINILRGIMSNDHFNLVVVYTDKGLEKVFDEVRWGLLNVWSCALSEERRLEAEAAIEDAEAEFSGLYEQLKESVGAEQYFFARTCPKFLRMAATGKQPYSKFFQICEEANIAKKFVRSVLLLLLEKCERAHDVSMNAEDSDDTLIWSSGPRHWIRGRSLFVCFCDKFVDDDLLGVLRLALYDWNPNPSRLFLAKLRAAMDEHGVVAQGQALSDKFALAYWYDLLLRAKDLERRSHVTKSVSRHSDHLMGEILPKVAEFANRLIEAEIATGDTGDLCRRHFRVDLANQENRQRAALEHNVYVCSKVREGWHISTGHVFCIENCYWICLSPACDMVPSQLSPWRIDSLGKRLPFIAVRLHDVGNKLPSDIQTNRYIFLKIEGNVRVFCFNDRSSEAAVPQWEILYADNGGQLEEEGSTFLVWRTRQSAGAGDDTNEIEPKLDLSVCRATVVGQVRYEYALNLNQKLGVAFTRVGLEFSDGRT